MFTFTVLMILLSEGRSVLKPTQRGTGSITLKASVKNQKKIDEIG